MPYALQLKELDEHVVEVVSEDEPSLAVIRDETQLHGYAVGEIHHRGEGFYFLARSDEPGKAREFLMGLSDVHTTAR
ncbi:MAG TPA: hypothetical protein VHC22_05840 [Pirellulales bacterium]|nr:hypothetical protein [Pirellulales bacterium]